LILVFGTLLTQGVILKYLFFYKSSESLYSNIVPFLLPYAFAPMALSVLLGRSAGLFATLFGSLWIAFHFSHSHRVFMITTMITGLVAVLATRHVRRRSRIIQAGIYSGLAAATLAVICGKIGPIETPFLNEMPWTLLFFQSIAAIVSGLCTAIVVSGLLPILESVFRIKTDISWLEMADLNHPLLRRLSIEAPGTYQHSLALSQLAETAAEAIGANTTICRVGAYFHDIGKLVKPEYFTENISSEKNPHNPLTPTMSALIIAAHIKEGVDLALKNRLPLRIIEIIREHHGTTMIRYFFQRAQQQQEDARLGGKMMQVRPQDIPDLATENFRYPGPKPQSRESAIIGLADAAESASRSIESRHLNASMPSFMIFSKNVYVMDSTMNARSP
jgi:putative nucleotidyltransferase with HDIG domain